jgi:hypothetical protein
MPLRTRSAGKQLVPLRRRFRAEGLTEYMLAALRVRADARLRCGLDFIGAETVSPGEPHPSPTHRPPARPPWRRAAALEHRAWEKTIERFAALVDHARRRKSRVA